MFHILQIHTHTHPYTNIREIPLTDLSENLNFCFYYIFRIFLGKTIFEAIIWESYLNS